MVAFGGDEDVGCVGDFSVTLREALNASIADLEKPGQIYLIVDSRGQISQLT